jgi:hypothetical protein
VSRERLRPSPDASAADEARLFTGFAAVLGELHAAMRTGHPGGGNAAAQLRALCGEAQRLNVSAARMLIGLKEAWRAEPMRADLGEWTRSEAELERVVTLCIRAYYRAGDGDVARAPA